MNQFRQFVVSSLGRDTWVELTRHAGVQEDHYKLSETYLDEELVALLTDASDTTDTPASLLLENFGAFLAPALLRVYAPLINPEWRTLDVIAHTEESIHTVVRSRMQGATPPPLLSRRISRDVVELDYRSPRRMCFVAKGIARGLAEHFGEEIRIAETECMHLGGSRCLMLFGYVPAQDEVSSTPADRVGTSN